MQLTISMLPQQHSLNSGMIVSGQHKNTTVERYPVDKSGIPMCKNPSGELQKPLIIPWNFQMNFQLQK